VICKGGRGDVKVEKPSVPKPRTSLSAICRPGDGSTAPSGDLDGNRQQQVGSRALISATFAPAGTRVAFN